MLPKLCVKQDYRVEILEITKTSFFPLYLKVHIYDQVKLVVWTTEGMSSQADNFQRWQR